MKESGILKSQKSIGSWLAGWNTAGTMGIPFSDKFDKYLAGTSFRSYVNTNGYLVVAASNSWVTCTSNYTNGAVAVLDPNAFCRVTVWQDFSKREFAVFLNGVLLKQQLPFPDEGRATYSSFRVNCSDGQVYLDDVLVTTILPGGLPSEASLIDLYGSTSERIGTIYTIR